VFSGRAPYLDVTSQAEIIERVRRTNYPNDINQVSIPIYLRLVVMECWQVEAELRPTASSCFYVLDSLPGLIIDRSQMAVREFGVEAEWTTGGAMLPSYFGSVALRRFRICIQDKQDNLA
ncbi:hypothetical protein FRB99_001828, partial [Tulasnella sp. 403]